MGNLCNSPLVAFHDSKFTLETDFLSSLWGDERAVHERRNRYMCDYWPRSELAARPIAFMERSHCDCI